MAFRAHFLLAALVLGLPQYSNGEFEPMAVTEQLTCLLTSSSELCDCNIHGG